MADVALLISDMVKAGVDPSIIGRVAAALAERDVVAVPVKDEQAERRRAADRERKRSKGGIPQNSADSAEQKRKEPKEKNIPLSPPKGGTFPKNPEPDSFSTFWQAYPNKTGKPKAEEAYRRAIRRANPAEILSGLNRVKPGWDDPQFIPHPTTWLNRDGWNDQAPAGHGTNPQAVSQSAPTSSTWDAERWKISIGLAVKAGRWEPRWGPPPDDPTTLCPIALRPLWTQRSAA